MTIRKHFYRGVKREIIMNKNVIILSCLLLLSSYMYAGYGGGFATGAILGTGITLAATSGSRNANRDPYYEVDRERARQEAREIREETRLRREEDRQRRKEERHLEQKRNRLAQQNKNKKQYTVTTHQPAIVTKKEITNPTTQKELEIKKLELELKKLELEHLQAAA